MTNSESRRWLPFVLGLNGLTYKGRAGLRKLVTLPKDRQDIYFAAMKGRDWMYQYANLEYWVSVAEAVDLAAAARDMEEEKRWFLAPIPDTKVKWASPIVRAENLFPAFESQPRPSQASTKKGNT